MEDHRRAMQTRAASADVVTETLLRQRARALSAEGRLPRASRRSSGGLN